jgi:hypothetical protein
MILIVVAAILGGTGSFVLLLGYGLPIAVLGAPLGGSLAAGMAGFYLACLRLRYSLSASRTAGASSPIPEVIDAH